MIASLYKIRAELRAEIVTNFVTNLSGNRGQSGANCHQFCYQTEGTPGHSRAMESSLLGNGGERRETQGNASLGLITQRSKVQILPPQLIGKNRLKTDFGSSLSSPYLTRPPVSCSFIRSRMVTVRWVSLRLCEGSGSFDCQRDGWAYASNRHQFCHQFGVGSRVLTHKVLNRGGLPPGPGIRDFRRPVQFSRKRAAYVISAHSRPDFDL